MTNDEIRERLIRELRPAEPWPAAPAPEVIADALLPVVRAIAADELRERAAMVSARAANEEDDLLPDVADALDEVSSWLNARAAALDPR